MVPHAPVKSAIPINYRLKSEVSIMLLCQLFSTRYTVIRIKTYIVKKYLCNQGSHYEKYKWFPLRKPWCKTTKLTLFCCQKRWMEHKGGHWLVYEECMVCTVGMSCTEATLNSEKFKLVILVISSLYLSEGIIQEVSQSVSKIFH